MPVTVIITQAISQVARQSLALNFILAKLTDAVAAVVAAVPYVPVLPIYFYGRKHRLVETAILSIDLWEN